MTISLEQALKAPMWDEAFWDAMAEAEKVAQKALIDLWDNAAEGGGCACDVHAVSAVFEALFPALTEQVIRLYSTVETLGSCGRPCNGNCKRGCNAEA